MTKTKRPRRIKEDFQASFGVPAKIPGPVTAIGGSDHQRSLDQKDGENSAFPFDDKGNPVANPLQTKAGMMNEIMSVLTTAGRSKVAETYSRLVEGKDEEKNEDEDEDRDEDNGKDHVDVGDKDEDHDEDEGDEKKFHKESRRARRRVSESRRTKRRLRESEYDMEEPDISGHEAWASENSGEAHLDESDDEYDFGDEDEDIVEAFGDEDEDEDYLDEDADQKSHFAKSDEDEDEDVVAESRRARRPIRKLRKEDLKIKYDVKGLFEGHNFTPEFQGNVKELFESAVLATVNENLARIDKASRKDVRIMVASERKKLVEGLDKYLDYVVKNFMTENKLAVETGLRMEQYDSFMDGLRGLFESHFISVDPSRRSQITKLTEEIDRLNARLGKTIKNNIQLKGLVEEQARERILDQHTTGMTLTQKDRLRSLSESVDYTDDASFGRRVSALKRAYISTGGRRDEMTPVHTNTSTSSLMESVDQTLARFNTTGGNL